MCLNFQSSIKIEKKIIMVNYEKELADYGKNGFAVIDNFLTPEEVKMLMDEAKSLIDNLDLSEHRLCAIPGSPQQTTDYYFASAGKANFFFEPKAFDGEGNLILPREKCVMKLGHGLHLGNKTFGSIGHTDRVRAIMKGIGYVEPAIVQGMLIFKHPRVGSEVTPHKDTEFLFSEPVDKVCALWIALTDVVRENGCLEVIPGSHVDSAHRRYIRTDDETGSRAEFNGPVKEYEDSAFVPVLVPKGSCLVFDGKLVHRSKSNLSDKPRPAYVIHFTDEHETKWSPDCWLQLSKPFPRVNG
ncbi:phytanoyl-CoA dioxygenase domain-containing protein 1-like [Panonychus citri]|uniref:phytanoyl-CoA dioxygenase domain-containing protein 1-like n=1 Tax=Panonychus citri TaxID=50023 RepID=UPI0023076E34|nr:phytanoyl-CoA dioxygenase domain-containing protein 1-like [Panonychus citri]